MKPPAFHSLHTVSLVSATVDIKNTIFENYTKERKKVWLRVITNADGYEAKADGVSN